MVYLLSSLLNSIQMLLYMFFMNTFFVRRHNSRLFWGYWLLWALIATVATNVFPSSIQLNGPFVFLMEIIILYGMNVTLYYGRWDRRLFTVVTSYAAIYSISSLMETLLLRITHMTRAEYLNNAPLYILFCFIRLGVLGIIVALINRFHAPLKELGKPRVWVPFATFFPLCTLFVLLILQTSSSESSSWTFCLFVMCVVDVVALFLFDNIESTAQTREALAVARQRADAQAAGMQALSDSYAAQRKMTHEFRGYLFTLSAMLDHGEISAVSEYLKQLQVQQTERILLVNSHNPSVDAVLNQKGYAAKNSGIDIRFEVNDLSEIKTSPVDLTIIIGNLLDNAIEACEKLPTDHRWITVKVIRDANASPTSIFLSVENFSLPVAIVNDHIATTKQEPELHGFGLRNVMETLHKYDAFHLMSYKNSSFLFCAEWYEERTDSIIRSLK